MNKAFEVVGISGIFLKMISAISALLFMIWSLYFYRDPNFGFFFGVLLFIAASIFIGVLAQFPLGTTFMPFIFEWYWHDATFWDFTTPAWIVFWISLVANILLLIGLYAEQREQERWNRG